MRRDKAPELKSHAGAPSGGADDAYQQAIGNHHPDGAEAGSDAHGEGREGDGEVIGHDGGRSERLNRDDGMSPHFAALDGGHHFRTEKAMSEAGIVNGDDPGSDASDGEDSQGDQSLRKSLAENSGIGFAVKLDEGADFGFVAHVDEVVAAAEQLVEISGKLAASGIFANGGEVRRGLTIQ